MGTNAQKEYFRPSGRYGYEQNQHPGYRFRREIPVGITDLIQHRPDGPDPTAERQALLFPVRPDAAQQGRKSPSYRRRLGH